MVVLETEPASISMSELALGSVLVSSLPPFDWPIEGKGQLALPTTVKYVNNYWHGVGWRDGRYHSEAADSKLPLQLLELRVGPKQQGFYLVQIPDDWSIRKCGLTFDLYDASGKHRINCTSSPGWEENQNVLNIFLDSI